MSRTARIFLFLSSLVLILGACSSHPQGRIMTADENDLIDNRGAGAATYDRLIEGAVQKLLQLHSASNQGTGKLKIATLAIENASGEELGDWNDHIFELIDTSINRSGRYQTISTRFVNEALRETRLRTEQLFLPKHRRAFMGVLETRGTPVECLLFPKLTRGTTRASRDQTQRNYMLTLELVDVQTGWNDKVSERLRKTFSR